MDNNEYRRHKLETLMRLQCDIIKTIIWEEEIRTGFGPTTSMKFYTSKYNSIHLLSEFNIIWFTAYNSSDYYQINYETWCSGKLTKHLCEMHKKEESIEVIADCIVNFLLK